MNKLLTAALAALLAGLFFPVQAAEKWGLPDEKTARFEATVVDVLCELAGNCPPDCGGGKRQLGLVDDNGILVLPLKNVVPFAGAAAELIDFCGKRVIADGLFTTNKGYRVFVIQFLRAAPAGKWRGANRFQAKWAARNGVAANGAEAKRWFENDPAVKALIAKDGKLGLGPKADRDYFRKLNEK
jgi:hypothetical protein